MRGIRSDQLIRAQVNYKPNEVKEESISIRNHNKIRRRLATRKVYSLKKIYEYNMFVGDSKTPVGKFALTLYDAAEKNKKYRDKFFFAKDAGYRLKTLKLTKESLKEVDDDIYMAMVNMEKENPRQKS